MTDAKGLSDKQFAAIVEAVKRPHSEATWLRDELERNRAELQWQEHGLQYAIALAERLKRAEDPMEHADYFAPQIDALAERLKACEDKAIKYDLDQAGIEQRAAEAVELVELRAKLKACEEDKLRVLRGEFSQICSYCGWESQDDAQWEQLQAHIKECEAHPATKLTADLEELKLRLKMEAECHEQTAADLDRARAEVERLNSPVELSEWQRLEKSNARLKAALDGWLKLAEVNSMIPRIYVEVTQAALKETPAGAAGDE